MLEVWDQSGHRFDSWDDLVEAQANGWVATAILRERAKRESLFTWTVGPFPSKREATNAGQRIRANFRRQEKNHTAMSSLVAVTVKPAWKDLQ